MEAGEKEITCIYGCEYGSVSVTGVLVNLVLDYSQAARRLFISLLAGHFSRASYCDSPHVDYLKQNR